MLKRVLIANRGEIARRIARTCARLGVEYVAVHSEADTEAEHLFGAFARAPIGPAPAAESYLNIDALVDAAVRHGCDAVHPGYGFLSENPRFAERVLAAGLTFVGPRPETIAAMGDKSTARALMAAAGVPVLPGSAEATESVDALLADARRIGYPLILKPTAGGGGKGMRVVHEEAELADAAAEAIRLGRAAFGDGRVLAERYVARPRHIEVQVFGDVHGAVVHLFERDCSLQRRHQKIVEEAPAAGLDPTVRAALLDAAVRGAEALKYVNAGTFEFILGPAGDFYFLEVNTRLQVEHPVTEEITGLDLVEWQLRVAAGEPLPLAQEEISATGHAVECRVYAEDPAAGFRPAPGRALLARWPESVRVEAAFEDAGAAPEHYDPLVAKLIAHGPDRATALRRLRAALGATAVLGLTTNVGFLARLLDEPRVRAGRMDTHLVDRVVADGAAEPEEAAVACAAAMAGLGGPYPDSPWFGGLGPLDRAALDPAAPLGRIAVRRGERERVARLLSRSGRGLVVAVDEVPFDVSGAARGRLWHGRVGPHTWFGLRTGEGYELAVDGYRIALAEHVYGLENDQNTDNVLRSTLPGTVVALPHAAGDVVEAGETVLVLEAMKMEHRLVAPARSVIASLGAALHDAVAAGQVLAVLEPAGDDLVEDHAGAPIAAAQLENERTDHGN
ncbi:ATP-grasp domain-containing protein [Actinospica durhamensis]|uniref:biotin carboxylase n=1 Tax=Actinospica durhamensis TaxID=1508375 RepID=A0A941EJT0_9ACTN|nr:biotin carboxylase N-terminal domain-containing protein [Actinospica durhamensis]MBR7832862.1 ATP-grasp domain-containing protein [Actinospica durhamensis]